MQACAAQPCCSVWLGAALAYVALGQLEQADLALTEANVLDPHNAAVWGHLAHVCAKSGRIEVRVHGLHPHATPGV